MKILFIALASLLCIQASAQQKNESITVDGLSRTFITYIPSSGKPNEKMPVIISLHGRLGTAERQMHFADFRPIADREKVIIVCPQGIDRSWNDGRGTPAHAKGINDVKFIDELITYIIKTYNADASRVYITGMSNGGFMTSRLACELPNRIAAIAVVAASMGKNIGFEPIRPIPVLYMQGNNDPLVPFTGGEMKTGAEGDIYGHEEILAKWASVNNCTDKPVVAHLPVKVDDGTSITEEVFENPANHVRVVGYTINGGGHTWPGGTQYLPRMIIGSLSHNLNACQAIWDFLKGNKLVVVN